MNNVLSTLTGESAGSVPSHVPLHSGEAAVTLVNLNEVMQYELVARQPQIQALQAIIRFDALPHVNSTRPQIAHLFNLVFNSIVAYPPAGTKLFIYIKCEKEQPEVMDLTLADGFQTFNISVFTNIVATESWQQQQQQALADIRSMVLSIKGAFESFRIEKTGCLYQLLLPGKFI